jgi:uncharacterized membrane protein YgcG
MNRVLRLLAALSVLGCLLAPATAWAKYVPPPPPPADVHCVTTVGWLSPSDTRKISEESEIARMQTGFVIDVLLAPSDEPIDEIASETFKAWKPGDPAKDNGILLVIQPNFPRGQRKVRMQVGTGVQSKINAAKGTEILRNVIGPLINDTDQIRTAIASGVQEIAKTVGADESVGLPDAGRPLAIVDASATAAPAPSASGPASVPAVPSKDEGGGSSIAIVLALVVVIGVGYVLVSRMGRGKS